MSKEVETERTEQIRFVGDEMERKIRAGDEVFLNQPERVWLKGMIERGGVDLSEMKDNRNLGNQAKVVAERLGITRTVKMTSELVVELVKVQGCGVFGKGNEVPAEADKMISEFVEEYLGEQLKGQEVDFSPSSYEKVTWKKNTIFRIEAILSATNKLLYAIGAVDQGESVTRQSTDPTDKYYRQRVIRGEERTRGVIRDEKPIIRFLPKGGTGAILDKLTEQTEV